MKNICTHYRLLLFLGAVGLSLRSYGQSVQPPVVQWQHVLPITLRVTSDGTIFTTRAVKAANGGYFVVASGQVLRLSESGELSGPFALPRTGFDPGITFETSAVAITPMPDGGVVALSRLALAWSLIRLGADGAVIWTKVFARAVTDSNFPRVNYTPLIRASDGGFVVLGSTFSGRDGSHTNLYKFDTEGNLSSQKILNYNPTNTIRASTIGSQIVATTDGGYTVLGYATANSSIFRGWAAKLDAQLSVVQQNGYDMQRFTDGIRNPYGPEGVIAAAVNNNGGGTSTLFVNPNGPQDNTGATFRDKAPDTSPLIASGSPNSHEVADIIAQNNHDIRLASFSASNEIRWSRILGGSGTEQLSNFITTSDGGLLIVGTTTSTDGDVRGKNSNDESIWLVKLGTTSTSPPTGELAVAQPIPNQFGRVGQYFSYRIPDATFSGPASSIDVSDLPRGLMYVNHTIMGTPEVTAQQTLTVTATDGTAGRGNAVRTTFMLTITTDQDTPVLRPPVLSKPIPDQIYTLGKLNGTSLNGYFTDPSGPFSRVHRPGWQLSASGLPDGIYLNANPNQIETSLQSAFLIGTPTRVGTFTVTIQAFTYFPDQPAVATFLIRVVDPAQATLAVAQPIPNQSGRVGEFFSYRIPDATFSGPVASIDVSDLPRGLMYLNRTIMGTPEVTAQQTLTVTATDQPDGRGNAVRTTFTLTILPAGGRMAAPFTTERAVATQVVAYPNPATDQVTVSINGFGQQPVRLRMMDLIGNTLLDKQIEMIAEQHEEIIDLSRKVSGLYLLQISTGSRSASLKVLKR